MAEATNALQEINRYQLSVINTPERHMGLILMWRQHLTFNCLVDKMIKTYARAVKDV